MQVSLPTLSVFAFIMVTIGTLIGNRVGSREITLPDDCEQFSVSALKALVIAHDTRQQCLRVVQDPSLHMMCHGEIPSLDLTTECWDIIVQTDDLQEFAWARVGIMATDRLMEDMDSYDDSMPEDDEFDTGIDGGESTDTFRRDWDQPSYGSGNDQDWEAAAPEEISVDPTVAAQIKWL